MLTPNPWGVTFPIQGFFPIEKNIKLARQAGRSERERERERLQRKLMRRKFACVKWLSPYARHTLPIMIRRAAHLHGR